MPRGGAGGKVQQIARRQQGQAVAVPAGGKIPVDVLAVLVGKVLEHPQHGVAPQAAEGAHPHRDAAVGQALGQDGPLRRDDLLTVQAGGGSVQQQVHRKGGVIFLFGAQKHPVIVQKRGAPHPPGVHIAAAGHPRVGLLMHQNAVADLLGEPQHHAAVQLLIFGVVGAVAVGLQLGLFGQMPGLRGGGLFRAGHARAEPQMAPQMHPGAQLLFGLAQPLRRVEGAAEAALDVGAVLRGVLLQGDVGLPFVHAGAAAGGVHGVGVLHGHSVGLDHLGGQGLGGKGGQQAVQMQVQRRFRMHGAVEEVKRCVHGQQGVLQLVRLRGGVRGQRPEQPALVGGHHGQIAPQRAAPAGRLHGVHQLVPGHPLLPGKFVLDGKKVVGVRRAQRFQHRAVGQLQPVGRVFEVEPRQIVQHGLPQIACPAVKDAVYQLVTVIFVHKAHDGVHVKIHRAVGVVGQKQRLKAIGARSRPDLIGRPPLLCGVALGFHQANSLAASSLAGMRAAITSRIRPCS